MPLHEFSLIERFFDRPSASAVLKNSAIISGIGDDCAILAVPAGKELVFSLDTFVAGVHFSLDTRPADIAWRLMGATVSDLAAMGAEPNNFTLALTLPELSESWLSEFSENLVAAAQEYNITLVGGDTTRGPLTLSVQVQGFVDSGCALLRSGANEGDFICVSGSLGDSKAGLSLLPIGPGVQLSAAQNYLLQRFYRPAPRVSTGLLIADCASACVDVSDGLLADLKHILSRSGVGAKINADDIPLSQPLLDVAGNAALDWALNGGEDFELCFTVPANRWLELQDRLGKHPVKISKIGVISALPGIKMLSDGQWRPIDPQGFNHFESDE